MMGPNGVDYDYIRKEAQKQQDHELALKKQKEDAKRTSTDARSKSYLDQARADRNIDLAAGRARGQELFKDGSLGRVAGGRGAVLEDVLKRRQANLEGFTPEEMNAQRDQVGGEITRGGQTTLRAMRGIQGASGIRGGLAGAQQAGVLNDVARSRAGVERDLFLKNIEAKRGALGDLEQTETAGRADELGREKYNQGQTNKEKFGQLGTEMGYGSLGSSERGSVMQRIIGEDQADAQRAAAEAGKK